MMLQYFGPVTSVVLGFIVISYVTKWIWEIFLFAASSNWKYRFLNSLGPYIHYGKYDIGIDASLSLDSPTEAVLLRRKEGQRYLTSKFNTSRASTSIRATSNANGGGPPNWFFRGSTVAPKLVDCRFALSKICMPLLRELEFAPDGRNFIVRVDNKENENDQKEGMITVETEDGQVRPYLGNNAVCTLGIKSFYDPIQKEINRRMSPEDETSRLRFAPISMNTELEKNVQLVQELTGMDQVSSKYILEVKFESRCF